MSSDRLFIIACSLVSLAGAVGLGVVVDDWRFSLFVAAIFAVPLTATVWQGVSLTRNNSTTPRDSRITGGRP